VKTLRIDHSRVLSNLLRFAVFAVFFHDDLDAPTDVKVVPVDYWSLKRFRPGKVPVRTSS
jgi:hypothetical protein